VKDARLLVRILRDPAAAAQLDERSWTGLIAAARAESLIGTLAHRVQDTALPPRVAALLEDARLDAAQARAQALWEAEMARRALAGVDAPVILLKGTAYAAAGLDAAIGRSIGDLDILVPHDALPQVEQALLAAGWEWVKEDAYDDLYYRRWMHELPPLIHRERDRMIDVHHTILPLTARPKPYPADLIDQSVVLENGLRVLSPEHMIVHAAAHLIADGDLAGGLRNLWDIDRLCRAFSQECEDFELSVVEEAFGHGLGTQVLRALRLSRQLFGTPLKAYSSPARFHFREQFSDRFFRARLLARNGWGQETRKPLRLAFYARSHLLRMPPLMLARHLWTKARK
jgi:hypothetical protein